MSVQFYGLLHQKIPQSTGSEMGTFELKAGKWSKDEKEDQSLATTQDARFYGASASFTPFSNKGKTLIVQYQAKYDKDVECGGGYIKLGIVEQP